MKKFKKVIITAGCNAALGLAVMAFTPGVHASPIAIDVSTNSAAWNASFGSNSGTAFHYSCGSVDCISISSTGFSNGTFVGGGANSDFLGNWRAELSFFLPSNAQNVSFFYQSIGVDDRATLSLNGIILGTFDIFGSPISQTITNAASFVLGGSNTIALDVVNAPLGTPIGLGGGDGTAVALLGSVGYSTAAVPEPGTFILACIGAAGLAWRRRTVNAAVQGKLASGY